jgi:hypothetical protein
MDAQRKFVLKYRGCIVDTKPRPTGAGTWWPHAIIYSATADARRTRVVSNGEGPFETPAEAARTAWIAAQASIEADGGP